MLTNFIFHLVRNFAGVIFKRTLKKIKEMRRSGYAGQPGAGQGNDHA